MAKYNSYNSSFHFTGMGIKGDDLSEEDYAKCLVCLRGTDFEDGNNIETEDDEGHTGTANLAMGKYRKSAESSPSLTDKLRFKEGLEDIIYLLLGNFVKNPASPRFDFDPNGDVNHFFYEFPPNNPNEPPACTIYNGYSKTYDDGRVFNNAYLSEVEFTVPQDDAPTVKQTYTSDYNDFNLANPTRNYLDKTIFVKPNQVNLYYADVDATLSELWEHKFPCFLEASAKINNNYDQIPCHRNRLGRNTKYMGEIKADGSFKLPWNDATKKYEPEYEGGDIQAHSITEEVLEKQLAMEFIGIKIGETEIPYRLIIHFPVIVLTNCTSPKSGTDVKDLTIEYEVPTKPEFSYCYIDLWTDLENHHVDNEGCNLSDLFYDENNAGTGGVNTPATYDVEFTVTDGTDPVDGATVTVGSESATTDATGKATITGLSGSVTYSVSKTGFTTVTDTRTVTGNTSVSITLTAE